MLAVPGRPQIETFEAWPIDYGPRNAGGDCRGFHAGGATQHVVGGIKAEITAKPKLEAAQAEMDVIAGAANSSSETKADGSAAAAEANGAMPTAEVRTCITAAANAETDGSVTAAAKAKTHAVTSTPASAAHRRLSCGQCRQREGKRCRGRQK
jgi:hypothetical protein